MVATPTTNITFQNFFSTTLSADITDTATDIFLNAVPNGSEGFLVIEPDSTTNREIIYYTSKTALKVTVPSVADGRGQDDTTAHSHVTGSTVIMAPVAAYYEALLSLFQTTPAGWTSITGNISAVTANGNRSYSLTTSSDNSAVISPGMRLRTTRTVSAPTQSASLNGSTQYFSKSSPSGMTFTDDFVVSAWVKLSSYANAAIVSRFNGTSGFRLGTTTSGQVVIEGYNGSSSNYRGAFSYQSLPLNKWVHIVAQHDMSVYTSSSTTCYIMIDGVDVPISLFQNGTNPTTLIQAGNLEIGSWNGGLLPFAGKIAQVAIYSAKVTQANIRATISQGLSGSETSLVSAYSFNNSINDLNASNANNLTANGSAVATNADSPFGCQADGTISSTLDYGIVQSATSSTLVVQVPEGCTIPTTGGVASASYSSVKAPYGFPSQKGKWTIKSLLKTDCPSTSNATYGSFISGGWALNVPVGDWNVGWQAQMNSSAALTGYFNMSPTALTGMTVAAGANASPYTCAFVSAAAGYAYKSFVMLPQSHATPQTYVMYSYGATTNMSIIGTASNCEITAENAYL